MPKNLKRNPNLVAIFPWGKVVFEAPLKTLEKKNHRREEGWTRLTSCERERAREGGLLENINKAERGALASIDLSRFQIWGTWGPLSHWDRQRELYHLNNYLIVEQAGGRVFHEREGAVIIQRLHILCDFAGHWPFLL